MVLRVFLRDFTLSTTLTESEECERVGARPLKQGLLPCLFHSRTRPRLLSLLRAHTHTSTIPARIHPFHMPAHLSGPFLPAGPSAGASAPRPAAPVAGGAAAPANPALTRRAAAATLLTAAASALALALAAPPPASAGLLPGLGKPLGGGGGARAAPPSQSPDPATTPTARAYLEVGLCPGGFRPDRALGDPSALCDSPEPLGRIEIGKEKERE